MNILKNLFLFLALLANFNFALTMEKQPEKSKKHEHQEEISQEDETTTKKSKRDIEIYLRINSQASANGRNIFLCEYEELLNPANKFDYRKRPIEEPFTKKSKGKSSPVIESTTTTTPQTGEENLENLLTEFARLTPLYIPSNFDMISNEVIVRILNQITDPKDLYHFILTNSHRFKQIIENEYNYERLQLNVDFSNYTKLENFQVLMLIDRFAFINKKYSNIVSMTFDHNFKITDMIINLLSHKCSSLKNLRISDCHKLQNPIISLANLTTLEISYCSNLKSITFNCPNLTEFYIYRCNHIKDNTIENLIAKCPRLQKIYIEKCEKISDETLEKIQTEHENIVIERI